MSEPVRVAGVTDQPLSVDRLLSLVRDPAVGGIAVFVGAVRNHDLVHDADVTTAEDREPQPRTRQVTALDYSAHPLAVERLAEVAARAAARDGVHAVAVEHRVGHLAVGDLAVVVAVGAEHRAAAFESCRQLIEELKSGVPIWKRQTFDDGVAEWVGLP